MRRRKVRTAKHRECSRLFPSVCFFLVAGISFFHLPTDLCGQAVQGHLTDSRTKFAVSGASVALRDDTGSVVARANGNFLGAFRIIAPGPGTYSLLAEAMGYRSTDSESFEVEEGEAVTIDLALTPDPLVMDTLSVVSRRRRVVAKLEEQGFYERQRAGAGSFLTPEQIRRWPAISAVDVLQHAPFVQVERRGFNSRITVMKYGECVPSLYIDGSKLQPGFDLDSTVRPEDMVAVEVYRGLAQIPPQYAGHESCGVILIWTKYGGG